MGFFGIRKKAGDVRRLLDTPSGPMPAGYAPGEAVPGTVAVYFADDPRKVYQLKQWLPVLERLDREHPVTIITRNRRTYEELDTPLRTVLAPAFPDLVQLYEASDYKVALYVNNSVHNFHSLMQRQMLHVHVNHGESDKVCMVSNQVKAYDRVFIAGEAARRRHRAALMEFDESKLVPVGRPQLDLRPAPVLPPSTQRTVLYAPTWEGENASNNYTSVDVFGPAIVERLLAVPDVRVVYKPHPRVAVSPIPDVAAGHREIVRRIARAGGEHVVAEQGDILAVFPGCDLMVTDVSSVGLDFLYLRRHQPMFVTDRYDDREKLHTDAPVSRCSDVVDSATIGRLTETVAQRLAHDEYRQARAAVRELYFGDLAPGESTTRFLAAIDDAVRTRDRHLSTQPAVRAAGSAEPTVRAAGSVEPTVRSAGSAHTTTTLEVPA